MVEQSGDPYDRLSRVEPVRTDAGEKPLDIGEQGTLSQRMRLSPKMSDTQVVDKRLFPILKEELDWLNNLPVSRVLPETLNPLRNILVKSLLQEYPEMSLAEAVSIVEIALTIAIDGEGRLDIIHLFSKMSESTQEEKANKL